MTAESGGRTILFVVTTLEWGGAELQVWYLSREFLARGWRVEVVSLVPSGPLQGRFEGCGIPIHNLGMRRGIPNPLAIVRLAGLVRRVAPSIVHSHMVHANLLARVAHPLFHPVPLVNSGHNANEGSQWRYYAYRYTDRWCDRFHTVSRIALDQYVEGRFASRAKLFYLPVGVPVESAPANDRIRARLRRELELGNAFTFLNVGRLEPQKDQAGLLRAFTSLLRHRSARLLVVGTGELGPGLERMAQELGISREVRFLGSREDVRDLMGAADAFVLSSRWEGLPTVVLEAGLAELPVVTTAVGDLPLLLEDDLSAFVVAPGDVGQLSRAMERMQALAPAERALIGKRLRQAVCDQCDLKKVTDGFERVYGELLEFRES